MNEKFDFIGLIVYDLANNHQGSIAHGLRIINEIAAVSNAAGVKGAIKFQFRNLDTIIHPAYRKSLDNRHIPRFLSTRLSEKEFETLISEVQKNHLITICTPFDEDSVDLIMKLDIEIIKIGSCSNKDWPLLEKVAETGKPVVCSTGGLNIKEIDNLVSFFQHRGVHFALMHCIGIYPTPGDKLQLNQIETLRNRYPQVTIGFSTHEVPDNFDAIKIAYAKGARLFERHVGIPTEEFKLNAYSSTPEQIKNWLQAYKETIEACGAENKPPVDHQEEESLQSLMRGVYVKKDLKKGTTIKKSEVYFAMPLLEKQLKSGEFKENLIADKDYKKDEPLSEKIYLHKPTTKEIIYSTIHEVKGMLNIARVPIGDEFSVEFSHHYGIERFQEVGAIIIDCINRAYCKKLIIQLSGQKHPYHYHKKKEETFQVLYGELEIEIEGKRKVFYPGDTIVIQQGVWHNFQTSKGVIFEEISTTHFDDDSFYEDKTINKINREERKTKLINWGRYQFD